MVFASRSNRCLRSASEENCAGKILIATVRPRRVSRARYTSPIPPAPSGETVSYGPSLIPGTIAIETAGIIARRCRNLVCCSLPINNQGESFKAVDALVLVLRNQAGLDDRPHGM